MGIIKTISSEDGRPYISLEDLIKEIKNLKTNSEMELGNNPYFLDIVLKTLTQMESDYYEIYLFKKRNN